MDGYESDSRQQLTFVKEMSHRPDFKAALRPHLTVKFQFLFLLVV